MGKIEDFSKTYEIQRPFSKTFHFQRKMETEKASLKELMISDVAVVDEDDDYDDNDDDDQLLIKTEATSY